MSIVVTHDFLKQLGSEVGVDTLKIMKRAQKSNDSFNYFISPKLVLHLYKAKVVYCNSSYIVLGYSKFESLSLLTLLRHSSQVLKNKIEDSFIIPKSKEFFGIAQETEETFRVRCSLSNKNITLIDSYTNRQIPFRLPKANSILDVVKIQIKNVWETPEKVGFNVELYEIRD